MNTAKNNSVPAANPAPFAEPAAPAAPAFDPATAKRVTPWRHEGTARTVAFHQPGEGGRIELFSATRVHIAGASADTVPTPVETPPTAQPAA